MSVPTMDHSCGSGSLAWEELQMLIDVIAAQCLELTYDIEAQRTKLDAQEAEVANMNRLLGVVRRQVQAGTLAVEAVSAMLSASSTARAILEKVS